MFILHFFHFVAFSFLAYLYTFPSYFINAILFYFILLKFNKSNLTNIFLIFFCLLGKRRRRRRRLAAP